MTQRQRKLRRRKRHTGRSSVLLGVGVLVTVAVIAALSAVGYVLAIAATAPDLSELKPDDKGQLSVVYAADGSRLGFIQSDVLRRVIPWRDIPVDLRRATVAIEDERFYKHDGVDLNAIVRAAFKNIRSGKTIQGGSTITFFDKHAKNLTLAESALLAGLPQAPSQYNPFRNEDAAIARRNAVLRQMAANNFITRAEAAAAMDERVRLDRGTRYT